MVTLVYSILLARRAMQDSDERDRQMLDPKVHFAHPTKKFYLAIDTGNHKL